MENHVNQLLSEVEISLTYSMGTQVKLCLDNLTIASNDVQVESLWGGSSSLMYELVWHLTQEKHAKRKEMFLSSEVITTCMIRETSSNSNPYNYPLLTRENKLFLFLSFVQARLLIFDSLKFFKLI